MSISFPRDSNRIAVIGGVSSTDGVTPVLPWVDPTTHRLLVDNATVAGTVTSVSVVSANGFAGTVATATTTPAITISTTITGLIKGNGTAISAASAGTDYVVPGLITASGLTMNTAKMLGRATAGVGAIEEIAVTGSGSAVLGTTPTLATPVINGLPTGTGVASVATASTLVSRDTNANVYANNFFPNLTSTVSAGGTTVLTIGSARTQTLTGTLSQTYQLPDATTLTASHVFNFNNNSSGSLIITNAGAVTQYTIPAGGAIECFVSDVSTANGVWDFHPLAPKTATWGSGTTGLVMNTALTTTPSVAAGSSGATAPAFIPQRGSLTTGFGGDSTNLYGIIGGTASFTSSATTLTAPQFTSNVATGTAPLVVSSTTRVVNLNAATAGNADTVTTNANLTGDVISTGNATTVQKINGIALSGLATGILKNTTTTGVPSIATGADLPVMTATVGGAVPTPPNNTTTFLRGDGTFATPAGSGTVNSGTIHQIGYYAATGTAISGDTHLTFEPANVSYGDLLTLGTGASVDGSEDGRFLLKTYSGPSNSKNTFLFGNPTSAVDVTIVFPGLSGTLATLALAETFTNKTLTSPKINENVVLTTTATKLNYLTSATGTTGTASTNIVFSTSPTLVTPTIGVATATSVNKVAITAPATSATLTIADGKTLTASNSITLAGTDVTTMTFPTTSKTIMASDYSNAGTAPTWNQDTTGKSAKTDALNSATTTVNVSSATAPTSGQVLTATSSTAATWQTPSTGVTPTMTVSTSFETAARFSQTNTGSGSGPVLDVNGLNIATNATGTSSSSCLWELDANAGKLFLGSPMWSTTFRVVAINPTGGTSFFGLGTPTVSGTGHTYTPAHCGFKIVGSGGVYSLYATQSDNTTETASSALATISAGDQIDLILKINSTTSISYYYRQNGGALSAATTLSTNMPTAIAGYYAQFSVSNNTAAANFGVQVQGSSYSR